MKYPQLVFAMLFFPLLSAAQAKHAFGKHLVIGTSATYIWEDNKDITQNVYQEITWDKNLAVSLTNSIYFGLSHKHIFTRGSSYLDGKNDKSTYFVTGAFAQYHFMLDRNRRFFFEMSYSIGDYCTCGGTIDPYRKRFLNYLGMGGGVDLPLWKGISLDLAFIHHHIFNKVPLKYGYNIYVVGLNYTLERP